MGKPVEQEPVGGQGAAEAPWISTLLASIGGAFSTRCVVVLVFSLCLFLSALFCLPPFRALGSEFRPDDQSSYAKIQASFVLEKPLSLVAAHAGRLEYDIFEEIGVLNTKVSIISMHSLAPGNSTYVVFGLLSVLDDASISPPALSVLRSSLVELELLQLNLSLTPTLFGHASSFEILKYPGGITVIPVQLASIWEIPQILFNFTLNNSISQIQKNIDEFKNQLKLGLDLRSYENVFVQLTNNDGSTVEFPITVEASVLSDIGSRDLLPNRLKQLAQVITGPHAKNLGLDHSVFGRVKQIQLSTYLQHSISYSEAPTSSPSPSPSISPSPLEELPDPAPPKTYFPTSSPAYAPDPCRDRRQRSPLVIPLPGTSVPGDGPQSPSPPLSAKSPCPSLLTPPKAPPAEYPYPPASLEYSPRTSSQPKLLGPVSKISAYFSPIPSDVVYSFNPVQNKGSGKALISSRSIPSEIPPFPSPNSGANLYAEIWLTLLLSFLSSRLLCGSY